MREVRLFQLLFFHMRSPQIIKLIKKNAEGGNSNIPFGKYHPPSLTTGKMV